MNADDKLNEFKKIRKVEVPPFLHTRIRAQIDALAEAPAHWAWSFAAASALLLLLNVGVLLTTADRQEQDGASLVQTMQLTTQNDLYHD